MNGCSLRFYLHENQKLHGRLLYEWLLDEARARGIHGGSAFRAISGFGRHGVLQEQHFFELAGAQTVLVEFIVEDAQADALLALVRTSGAPMFHARFPATFGMLGDGPG
jgi:PII-like signaling protein